MSQSLIFLDDRYERMGAQLRDQYANAQPFPHIVIDDFLPVEVCEQLLGEFPKPDQIEWMRFEKHHSRKLATRGGAQFGTFTRELLNQFNSFACLRFLEGLTGIDGLIPDPHFEGGGLHQIETGGFLKVHTDFNFHSKLKLDRRINLIVYLNKDWQESYNGHLELWDRNMTQCVTKVLPIYNRCVVFSTTDWSYHGHPEKLTCPKEQTRKSLALYYYTNGRPQEEKSEVHGTMWQERPPAGPVSKVCAGMLRGVASTLEGPAKLLRRLAGKFGGKKAA